MALCLEWRGVHDLSNQGLQITQGQNAQECPEKPKLKKDLVEAKNGTKVTQNCVKFGTRIAKTCNWERRLKIGMTHPRQRPFQLNFGTNLLPWHNIDGKCGWKFGDHSECERRCGDSPHG